MANLANQPRRITLGKQHTSLLVAGLLLPAILIACGPNRGSEPMLLDESVLTYETVVSLVRSACDGFCPAYRVTLRGNGQVLYEGLFNVETEGSAQGSVEHETVMQVLERFREIDFFSFQDRYVNGEEGCPMAPFGPPHIRISLSLRGRHKEVNVEPCWFSKDADELWDLAELIDQATGTERWIAGGDADP